MKISEILEPGQQQPIENEISRLHDERDRLRQRANQLAAELEDRYNPEQGDELKAIIKKLHDMEAQLHSAQNMAPDDKVWRILKTECSEFLEVLKSQPGRLLLRGMRGQYSAVFQGRGWANRRSKDSSPRVSMVWNYCLAQLGFAARRDNSTFVTTYKNLAKEFGQIYLIFPKNGFKFTYTSQDDLVLDSSHMAACVDVDKIKKTVEWLGKLREDPLTSLQAEFAQVPGSPYENLTVYSFMDNIMSFTPEETEQFVKETGVNMDWREFVNLSKFQDTYQPKQKDLSEALRSGTEIYILGEYIALDAGKFEKAIENLIETDL